MDQLKKQQHQGRGGVSNLTSLAEELRRSKQRQGQGGITTQQSSYQSEQLMTFAQQLQTTSSRKHVHSIIQEEDPSSQMEHSSSGNHTRMKQQYATHRSQQNLISQQHHPVTARSNKSMMMMDQEGEGEYQKGNKNQPVKDYDKSVRKIPSTASIAMGSVKNNQGEQQHRYQKQSSFNSDAISAIKPLKSTTSASQLTKNNPTGIGIVNGGKNKRHGQYGATDQETTRDFLYTEDFNDSGNEGGGTSNYHQSRGKYAGYNEDNNTESMGKSNYDEDYDDDYGEDQDEDGDDDDSIDSDSMISNPLRDFQESAAVDKTGASIGHYVLFIDPESFIYYRKDLRRNDYIVFEPFQDETLKKEFEDQNRIHLYKIRKLLVLEGFSWNFKGEADLYRRRHFPRQFLQNESSDYPCYVFQSELSKAFNHKGDIETIVDLIEYKLNLGRGNFLDDSQEGNMIRFKESLVTSTKEFIKNILRKVYEKYKVKIKAKPNYDLILKADGYREYFEGNYQLLQYERVRLCLRKNEPMKLILTEIPKNYRDKKFPPIFRNKNEVPPAGSVAMNGNQSTLIHQNTHDEERETCFRFKTLKGSSPYFWYPPVPNLKLLYERMEKSAKSKNVQNSVAGGIGSGTNIHSQVDRSFLRKVVYVAPDKDLVSLTEHRDKTGGTTIPKQSQQIILHSGECNWRFKFKLVGLERLNVIFNEIRHRVATDNKNTEPRNVTLKHSKLHSKRVKKGGANESSTSVSKESQNDTKINDETIQLSMMTGTAYNSQQQSSNNRGGDSGKTGFFSKIFKKSSNQDGRTQSNAEGLHQPQEDPKPKKHNEEAEHLMMEIPYIIKQTMKHYAQNYTMKLTPEELKEEEKIKKKKKKKGGHGHGEILQLSHDKEKYVEKELAKIHTPFCNFSSSYETIIHYQNILNVLFGKASPLKLQVECTLYHGCEVLTNGVFSDEVYFNNTVTFDQWITFGNLRYCQIPMKTRLSFNINLLTREGQILTIGCVSMNLFDEKGRFRNGLRELNVWPFYELDERLGCMKEYNGLTVEQTQAKDFFRTIDSLFTKLVVEFESFITPLYYSSRDEKRIEYFKLSSNKEDTSDKFNLINVQIKNQDLAQLKKYLNCNPLSKIDEQVKKDLFKCREHYQTHPQGLPIFLRSVQWNRPIQVNEVYKMLTNWAPMKPEEAISLLDAKFPDERVRQYAVQRISQLSDDDLALYMLQFAQALLYEEQHYSPLAEMLIERSLKNPYVVGHAFYWSLKSNLYLKVSYERYYVLLEQFLMLCGKFKEEIWIQQKVNTGLKTVSEGVVYNRYTKKISFGDVKNEARKELRNQRKKLPFLFTMTIDPKIVIKDFKYDKLTVFSSKKVPLCISSINQQPGGENFVCIFKNGDDLRQDILTLQIIYIMDKIWLANNLDLAMTPYKVLGTDCEQGYLEFVANCRTLAMIQYDRSVFHTFSDDSIELFMENYLKGKYDNWQERLKKCRQTFIRSTAGYCVASYILGLGDRHPDNIMINVEDGNFLHIDFGHFLGNVKKKFGIKRERDPFVFSKEVAYFVNGGPLNKNQANSKVNLSRRFTEDEHRELSESILTGGGQDDVFGTSQFAGDDNISFHQQAGGVISQDDSDFIDESMKSRSFRDFEEKCCQAFNILRKEGHQLINMFLIMLSAGMPELKQDDDIQFLVNRLDLGISEQEASNKFKKEIQRAMQTYSRRFDNFIHNIKAKYGK